MHGAFEGYQHVVLMAGDRLPVNKPGMYGDFCFLNTRQNLAPLRHGLLEERGFPFLQITIQLDG
ncbi:hypothetical protein D3C81_2114270 [compost metagenome]